MLFGCICSLFPTTCIISFQLELRRKQFHVLLSTIHELQQTLESKCCSLVIGITGLGFSRPKGMTTSSRGDSSVQLRLVTSCIGRIFSPVVVQSLRLLWFSSTSYPLCCFLTSFRLICRQHNSFKCEVGE